MDASNNSIQSSPPWNASAVFRFFARDIHNVCVHLDEATEAAEVKLKRLVSTGATSLPESSAFALLARLPLWSAWRQARRQRLDRAAFASPLNTAGTNEKASADGGKQTCVSARRSYSEQTQEPKSTWNATSDFCPSLVERLTEAPAFARGLTMSQQLRVARVPIALVLTPPTCLFRMLYDSPRSNRAVRNVLAERLNPAVPLRITKDLHRYLWLMIEQVWRTSSSPCHQTNNATHRTTASAAPTAPTTELSGDHLCFAEASIECSWFYLMEQAGSTLVDALLSDPKTAMYQCCCLWFFQLLRASCHHSNTNEENLDDEALARGVGDEIHASSPVDALLAAIERGSSETRWRLLDTTVNLDATAGWLCIARAALQESFCIFLEAVSLVLAFLPQAEANFLRLTSRRRTETGKLTTTTRSYSPVTPTSGTDATVDFSTQDSRFRSADVAAEIKSLLCATLHAPYEVTFHVEDGLGRTSGQHPLVAVPEAHSHTLSLIRTAAERRGAASAGKTRDLLTEHNRRLQELDRSQDRRQAVQEEAHLRRREFEARRSRIAQLRMQERLQRLQDESENDVEACVTTPVWTDPAVCESAIQRRRTVREPTELPPPPCTSTTQRASFVAVERALKDYRRKVEATEQRQARRDVIHSRQWNRVKGQYHGAARVEMYFDDVLNERKVPS